MVRLSVLAGASGGRILDASQFPIRVGRGSGHDLVLDEPGVWPNHFSIQREKNDLLLSAGADGVVSLNDEPVPKAPLVLRNGDIIGLGSVKIRFGFVPVRQGSLRWRERLIWIGLAALAAAEVFVAYSLW